MNTSLYNRISPFLAAFLVMVSLSFAVEAYAFAVNPGGVQGGVQQPVRVACPQVLAPVCGVNGVTYDNQCVAEYLHGVPVKHQGPCRVTLSTGVFQPPLNPIPVQPPCFRGPCFRPPGNPVCDPTWNPPCIGGSQPPVFNPPPRNPVSHCFPQFTPAGVICRPPTPISAFNWYPPTHGGGVFPNYIPTNPSSYGVGSVGGISYIPSNPSSYGIGGGSGVGYIPTNPSSYGAGLFRGGSYLPVSPWSYGFR